MCSNGNCRVKIKNDGVVHQVDNAVDEGWLMWFGSFFTLANRNVKFMQIKPFFVVGNVS